jgi:predicted PurR-regulated permease PerM
MRKFLNNEHAVSIDPSTIIFTVFFLISVYFLFYIREIVITLFCAFILMSALNPGIKMMQRRFKIPRALGIVISFLLIIFVVGLALVVILPPLFGEVPNLLKTLSLPPVLMSSLNNFQFSESELSSLFN